MFVLLDKEYKQFCPKLAKHFGRPLRLKKCLYSADFSGRSWYETFLDDFLTKTLVSRDLESRDVYTFIERVRIGLS